MPARHPRILLESTKVSTTTPLRSAEKRCGSSLQDHVNGAVVFGEPLKARWFNLSTRGSGRRQGRQDTTRVPVKQGAIGK